MESDEEALDVERPAMDVDKLYRHLVATVWAVPGGTVWVSPAGTAFQVPSTFTCKEPDST